MQTSYGGFATTWPFYFSVRFFTNPRVNITLSKHVISTENTWAHTKYAQNPGNSAIKTSIISKMFSQDLYQPKNVTTSKILHLNNFIVLTSFVSRTIISFCDVWPCMNHQKRLYNVCGNQSSGDPCVRSRPDFGYFRRSTLTLVLQLIDPVERVASSRWESSMSAFSFEKANPTAISSCLPLRSLARRNLVWAIWMHFRLVCMRNRWHAKWNVLTWLKNWLCFQKLKHRNFLQREMCGVSDLLLNDTGEIVSGYRQTVRHKWPMNCGTGAEIVFGRAKAICPRTESLPKGKKWYGQRLSSYATIRTLWVLQPPTLCGRTWFAGRPCW